MPEFSILTQADRVREAASLPTREKGSILPYIAPSPLAPGWSVFETQARTIRVDALKWPRSLITYDDMCRDPQIQGLLMSVALPIRHMQHYVDPKGTTGTVAEEIAEDFGLPLLGEDGADEDGDGVDYDEHLRLALLALAVGHKAFEETGAIEGNGPGAKYRLRGLCERPNETIQRIDVTAGGDLLSIRVPSAEPDVDGPFVDVPDDHLLYYCWDRRGADWTGRPLLYGLYRAWLLKDELIREDATMTRRFGGIPVVETTDPNVGKAELQEAAIMAQHVQSGDGAGVATPYGTRLRILGVEGTLPKPLESVKYHDAQMARAFMQMVMELGNSAHGSRALGATLMDHYALGVLSIAKWVRKSQMRLVRRIVTRNYGSDAPVPHIRSRQDDHEDIATVDLVALIDSGAIVVDDDLEAQIRERGNLVPRNPGQAGRVPASAPTGPAGGTGAGGGSEGGATAALREVTARRPAAATTASNAPTVDDGVNTGVMVALYPPTSIAEGLALPDGEPADALHVTLAFLGHQDALADPEALMQVVAAWAASVAPGSLNGQTSGTGTFDDTGDGEVHYASVDIPGLSEERQRLVEMLGAAGFDADSTHSFTPHITLAYRPVGPLA